MDPESARWVNQLTVLEGPAKDVAVRELHQLMLRAALTEAARRSGTNGLTGQELEDLAHQAASDAVVSILRRVEDFRGASRFTTWAYKFAILEVSQKIGRHVWRRDGVHFDESSWDRLPERLGQLPEDFAEARELLDALKDGVKMVLTHHQRQVFTAIVLHGSPLEAVVAELGTNRNAVYKTMFDARKKLRAHLLAQGLLGPSPDPSSAVGQGR